MPRNIQIVWAAGLFEGEGCTIVGKTRGKGARLVVRMTDEDVIRSFREIVGVGQIYEWESPVDHYKKQWIWQVDAKWDCEYVIRLLKPYMHSRRLARMIEAEGELERTGPNRAAGERTYGCGTNAGYAYHRKHNTDPCLSCQEAHREDGKRRRQNHR